HSHTLSLHDALPISPSSRRRRRPPRPRPNPRAPERPPAHTTDMRLRADDDNGLELLESIPLAGDGDTEPAGSVVQVRGRRRRWRSEEHTSELQSLA